MIQNIFILDGAGAVLIEKSWRGPLQRSIVEQFWDLVQKHAPFYAQVPPIHPTGRQYLLHIQGGGLFFVAVCASDTSPLQVFAVLERIRDLVQSYLGYVSDVVVKEQFMTVYHLVDEVLDGGLPFNLEPNILHELIRAPTLLNRTSNLVASTSMVAEALPEGVLSGIPWRRANVKYTTNEIYLDMIEELDGALDGVTGQLQNAVVRGRVVVDSQLSAVPDLVLKLSQPSLLDDIAFHPCVRLARFQREKVISFVPPDGKFQLMEYRVNGDLRMPLTVRPMVSIGDGNGSISISLATKGDKPVEDIAVTIPFDSMCNGTTLTSKTGAVNFDEVTKTCTWNIKSLSINQSAMIEGTFHFDNQNGMKPSKPLVQLKFRVTGWCASGLKVDSLTLVNEKYNHFKGVKIMTMGGALEVRI
jgi:AP-3 complex subunit mu